MAEQSLHQTGEEAAKEFQESLANFKATTDPVQRQSTESRA